MNKPILTVVFVFMLQFASAQIQPNIYRKADKVKMDEWVDSVYSSMTDALIISH